MNSGVGVGAGVSVRGTAVGVCVAAIVAVREGTAITVGVAGLQAIRKKMHPKRNFFIMPIKT